MRMTIVRLCIVVALLATAMSEHYVLWGQEQPSVNSSHNPSHTFEPSRWTVEDQIAAVENGLIGDPILLSGEPARMRTLAAGMEAGSIPGLSVAVVDNYRLAWAKGYGVADVRTKTPVTPDTLFNAGGITKAITAVVVLRVFDKRHFSLDDNVNKYLKRWKLPDNQFTVSHPVTVRELLSHSSGISGHFPNNYNPATAPTLLQILEGQSPATSPPIRVTHQPDTDFEYSSAAFSVVQEMLTEVTGKIFSELVRDEVFRPAGMSRSTFVQPQSELPDPERAAGHVAGKTGLLTARITAFPELATSGLWTTPSDLARFVIALQKSGEKGGLLSRSSYQQLLKPVINNVGLGVFVAGSGRALRFRVRGSDGMPSDGFAGWLVGYAEGGKGAVIMSNCNGLKVGFSLLRSIAQQYGWLDYIPVREVFRVDPALFVRYIGRYDLAGDVITISTDGSTLFGQIDDSPKFAFLASSPVDYFLNHDLFHEVTVHFVETSANQVNQIDFQYPYRTFSALRIK